MSSETANSEVREAKADRTSDDASGSARPVSDATRLACARPVSMSAVPPAVATVQHHDHHLIESTVRYHTPAPSRTETAPTRSAAAPTLGRPRTAAAAVAATAATAAASSIALSAVVLALLALSHPLALLLAAAAPAAAAVTLPVAALRVARVVARPRPTTRG
ncbi:hypothetical protein NGM07_21015 (plasmid) [Halorussus vallis]|uniref:hypothetical protein n=1 Tax=Halorussus vallis TaxID=2953749 RepID=UPI00209DDF22|nr:hypothetical protein [Halorussus vallis]USZ78142.1 hypothetical protein NGM07_21015 [Halorussus vallis]